MERPGTTVARLAAVTSLAWWLVACACPQAGSPGAQADNRLIASGEGPFQASDLVLHPDSSGSQLSGRIKNETGKLWEFVDFEVTLRDASGKPMASSALRLRELAPGQTRPIGAAGCERISHAPRERPPASFDLQYKGGELATAFVFALTKPAASGSLTYSDAAIHIAFRPTRHQIGFTAVNQSPAPMKIDWRSASFVDTAGQSHRIVDKGDTGTLTTVIAPGARVSQSIHPLDGVPHAAGRSTAERPIFPNAPAARALKGRSFSVFLPIEVGGKVQTYQFAFVIIDVVAG